MVTVFGVPNMIHCNWRCLFHMRFRTNCSLRSIGPEATLGSSCLSIHLVFDHLFGPQATFQEERALSILWTCQCSRLPVLPINEGWPAALRRDASEECSNTIRSCPASMQKRQERRANTTRRTRRTKRARTPVSASSQNRDTSRRLTLTWRRMRSMISHTSQTRKIKMAKSSKGTSMRRDRKQNARSGAKCTKRLMMQETTNGIKNQNIYLDEADQFPNDWI